AGDRGRARYRAGADWPLSLVAAQQPRLEASPAAEPAITRSRLVAAVAHDARLPFLDPAAVLPGLRHGLDGNLGHQDRAGLEHPAGREIRCATLRQDPCRDE